MCDRTALLFGPYRPPRFTVGGTLTDATLGRVTVIRVRAATIPWPMTHTGGRHRVVLCGDLCRAVRTEAARTVAHWWGVSTKTVATWRQTLGVGRVTAGTSARMSAAKRAARPKKLKALKRPLSDAARANISAAAKRRAKLPPAAKGPPWTPKELAVLDAHPNDPAAVARLTGRSVSAVYSRRHVLRTPRDRDL